MLSTLHALWQADGAFPSGSFAFSYGIEGAIALQPGMQVGAFAELLSTVLRHRWATYDRIALLRSFRSRGNLSALAEIDREIESSTLVEGLRNGSRRNGASFVASHARLGNGTAIALRSALRTGECLGHVAVMQGAIWSADGLDARLVQLTSGYAVASNLVTAAIRLGAIGALQGQAVLKDNLPLIERLVSDEPPEDAELASFIPFLDVAAARHARADLRLFAN